MKKTQAIYTTGSVAPDNIRFICQYNGGVDENGQIMSPMKFSYVWLPKSGGSISLEEHEYTLIQLLYKLGLDPE